MIWIKKNLVFTIVMALFAGIFGVEAFYVLGKRATAREAERELNRKVDDYVSLVNQRILPHSRNVELTADEIERQREEMRIYMETMGIHEDLLQKFARHPTSRSNAVFDIQFFVDEYRAQAAAIGLEGLDDEFFGFEDYSQTGPSESLLPIVYRQRIIVAHILACLFKAHPDQLISVRRPGEVIAETQTRGFGDSRGFGDDRFQEPERGTGEFGEEKRILAEYSLGPELTAAKEGIAEASAYEVVFTGRASTLRTFLNQLAGDDMPLIVRSVEVEPPSDAASRRQQETATRRRGRTVPEVNQTVRGSARTNQQVESEQREENVPLVADNLSRFTVAMEFIELLPLQER